jgi:hypothetical protein
MYVSMACLLRVPTVIKAELKEETRLISDDGKMGHVGVGWCSNWTWLQNKLFRCLYMYGYMDIYAQNSLYQYTPTQLTSTSMCAYSNVV